jgi:hypothetical protein
MASMLEEAVAHIRAGNIEQARPLLVEVIKQNPRDENAWLWMTKCVTEPEKKRYCFERVLQINPQNQHAIRGLERLSNPVSLDPPTQPKAKVVQQQPIKKKGLSTAGTIAIIGLGSMIVLLFICSLLSRMLPRSSTTPAPTTDPSGGRTMAYVMCQKFIEERLVAPATADWPSTYDVDIFTVEGKTSAWQIRGYVDAENRMGAFIRNYYICEVSYVGDETWHLDYLKFDE